MRCVTILYVLFCAVLDFSDSRTQVPLPQIDVPDIPSNPLLLLKGNDDLAMPAHHVTTQPKQSQACTFSSV